MSFQDVFRKSFLEGYASLDIQIGEILLCMVCTLLLSIYIFHVYKMLNRNSFYFVDYCPGIDYRRRDSYDTV